VRRLFVLVAVLLAVPAAAARPASPPPPTTTTPTAPALTLSAPGATTYGHEIDFLGRLTPAVSGQRVRLLRGTTFVAATATNAAGGFEFKVAIARPGPVHAEAAGIASPSLTVRIVPFLVTSLVGARVAGSPLSLTAKLRPDYAGTLRIRVERSGERTYSQLFGASATVSLGTSTIESFKIVVEDLPEPGFAALSRTLTVGLRPPSLTVGSRSPLVAEFLRRLDALGYEVPSTTTQDFDYDVLESVYAFEKVEGLDRTGVADATFWSHLDNAVTPTPRYYQPSAHIEVDKAKQVLYVVRNGKVIHISPVSTAGLPGRFTPEGRFSIFRKVPGYDPSPLGILYKPMYFTGGYAIHGNPSVPPYPASHGCIRVPNFVIERLYETEPYGETVYVY
jgi:peptidoglycan hydrolase-like protein with peptidoglycan-binding domain